MTFMTEGQTLDGTVKELSQNGFSFQKLKLQIKVKKISSMKNIDRLFRNG